MTAAGTERAPTLAEPRRFLLLANPRSGKGEDRLLVERAQRELRGATTTLLGPDVDVAAVVAAAVQEGRVVVVAGGDGTVNAVATTWSARTASSGSSRPGR